MVSVFLLRREEHVVTMVRSRRDRQFEIIQNRVSLYQYFIYQIRIMINNPQFHNRTEDITKIGDTIKEIDSQLEE
jgi:hypothetical protein